MYIGRNRHSVVVGVESGMHAALCETEGQKNLLACSCQVELHRDLVLCVCAHVCILEKLLREVVHSKIILLTEWKINAMSPSLPGSAVPRGRPHGPHGGALTQHLSCLLHLLLFSPDCLLFQMSLLVHYLSCPLVLLSSVDRG